MSLKPWKFVNRTKRKILEGKELVFGCWTDTCNPDAIHILAKTGFDFMIMDLEHHEHTLETAANAVIYALAYGIAPCVRIPKAANYPANPSDILKVLDSGAYGIWVPHVETKEELEQIVGAAKFYTPDQFPNGCRGASPATTRSSFFGSAYDT